MRKPTAYRRRCNLREYCRALVEHDRAEADAERIRQDVNNLMLHSTDTTTDGINRAMGLLRLALHRRNYARRNVTHYQQKVRIN